MQYETNNFNLDKITEELHKYGLIESKYRLGFYDEKKDIEIDFPCKGSISQISEEFKERKMNKNTKYIIITSLIDYVVIREVIVDDKNINNPYLILKGLPAFIIDKENADRHIETDKKAKQHKGFKLHTLNLKDIFDEQELIKKEDKYYNLIIKDFSLKKSSKYVGHLHEYLKS